MQLIRAVELPGRGLYEFVAWLDEERTVPDPTAPEPDEGQEDKRERVPDPAWCVARVWQIEPHPDQSDSHYQAAVVERLTVDEWAPELERRQAAAERQGEPEDSAEVEPVRLAVEGKAL